MLRRSLLILLPLAAAATGCTTFSDSDAVARVNDVELTRDDFEAQLTELGVADTSAVSLDPVRAEITRWIQRQLLPDDEVASIYDMGPAESGITCFSAIVAEDEPIAESALGDLEAGTDFVEVFDTVNLDPSIAASKGAIPCLTLQDLTDSADIPFIAAAGELSADNPLAIAPVIGTDGSEVAWVVLRFRPFTELEIADADLVSGEIDVSERLIDADIFVSSRYGAFDMTSGQVVALR